MFNQTEYKFHPDNLSILSNSEICKLYSSYFRNKIYSDNIIFDALANEDDSNINYVLDYICNNKFDLLKKFL